MMRHLDLLSMFASEDVEAAVVLVVEVLASHEGSHLGIVVELLQFLPIVGLLVLQIHDVVRSPTFVLLPSLVHLRSNLQPHLVLHLHVVHTIPAILVFLEPLLSQVVELGVELLELVLPCSLVSNSEVFVKPVRL